MFKFLLEGNIGELLAPIKTPEQQLFVALQNGDSSKALQLLNVDRVNPTAANERGMQPIHLAAKFNHISVVETLIQLGANVNVLDGSGYSPLHYAALGGHMEMTQRLLTMGVQVAHRNQYKQTAYDIASNHLVRQYLLPLQLKAESEMPEFQQSTPGISTGYGVPGGQPGGGGVPSAPVAPPPIQPGFQPQMGGARPAMYAAAPLPGQEAPLPAHAPSGPLSPVAGLALHQTPTLDVSNVALPPTPGAQKTTPKSPTAHTRPAMPPAPTSSQTDPREAVALSSPGPVKELSPSQGMPAKPAVRRLSGGDDKGLREAFKPLSLGNKGDEAKKPEAAQTNGTSKAEGKLATDPAAPVAIEPTPQPTTVTTAPKPPSGPTPQPSTGPTAPTPAAPASGGPVFKPFKTPPSSQDGRPPPAPQSAPANYPGYIPNAPYPGPGSINKSTTPTPRNSPPVPQRFIPSDGFHTSTSDPKLQALYGHTKVVKNVAPPPSEQVDYSNYAGAGMYSMYGSGQPSQYRYPSPGGYPGATQQPNQYMRQAPQPSYPPQPYEQHPPAPTDISLVAAQPLPFPGSSNTNSNNSAQSLTEQIGSGQEEVIIADSRSSAVM